ncbi:kinesin-like protein KIF19 [Trichonephila inaurata madagascariensis]|uniref:Kinesin-like protein KIF19 n=1 Tax=Trichonephila inaurata madagascariensis TaxID=2747483 RepID=A0A8X6Y2U1_9ARAC|nr:kinesin-like protein KIF19 [Trichonephila inaurata madagascariensis]
MVGIDDDPGIMVRALKDLFKEVDMKNKMYDVSMSYLEIYNENIRDLLNPSTAQLELREDAKGNHQVAGLSEVEIFSSEEDHLLEGTVVCCRIDSAIEKDERLFSGTAKISSPVQTTLFFDWDMFS